MGMIAALDVGGTSIKSGVVDADHESRGADAVALGDTPYDAQAAGKAGIRTLGVLCGGFTEDSLRQAGCVEVYPGPAGLFARFAETILAK